MTWLLSQIEKGVFRKVQIHDFKKKGGGGEIRKTFSQFVSV